MPSVPGLLPIALAASLAAGAAVAAPTPPPVTPQPAVETLTSGAFTLDAKTAILAPPGDAAALADARYLADLIARSRGLKLAVREGEARPGETAIRFRRAGPDGEAYELDVGAQGMTLSAAGEAGLFYAAVTAWQLATPSAGQGPVTIPGLHIEDAPRFAWRGLLLDSARHFQSVAYVKRFIDRMALEKLNTFHWHLTDDQGWRLEIRKYPRLTEVGAWRVPAGAGPAADLDPRTHQPRKVGGFYTQDQVREIVAYAAARHVTIVPEIDIPGHAQAAIAAYPQLASIAPAPDRPSSDWGVHTHLFNVDEATFGFLQDVLDEVMGLFPGVYVHTGGDEAVKTEWKASPAVQARMRELHIADEDALQGWFVGRIGAYLAAHGRRQVGWDEILEGGVGKTATVMSWRGVDGAIVAAKLGHDAVVTPEFPLYFDRRNSDSPAEPPGRLQVIALKDIYAYDPMPAVLTPAEGRHVLGLQANIWTEHMRTEPRVDAMTFPRAAAVAEAGWTPQARRDWAGFADRLPAVLDRDRALGLGFDEVPLQVQLTAEPAGDAAKVTMRADASLGEVRFTLDGSPRTAAATPYREPVTAPLGATVRAALFRGDRALAPATALRLDPVAIRTRRSQELALCSAAIPISLEDDAPTQGPRAVMLADLTNPCWIWRAAPTEGALALEAAVGQLPFNFQIGDDIKKIRTEPPATAEGELVVRRDSCSGPVWASLPLAPATKSNGVTVLKAALPPLEGRHGLCFTFTRRGPDPIWAIDRVSLIPAERPGPIGRPSARLPKLGGPHGR